MGVKINDEDNSPSKLEVHDLPLNYVWILNGNFIISWIVFLLQYVYRYITSALNPYLALLTNIWYKNCPPNANKQSFNHDSERKVSSIINLEPVLFSHFLQILKESDGKSNVLNIGFHDRLGWSSIPPSRQCVAYSWHKSSLSKINWDRLIPEVRNQVIQDFIQTSYQTLASFDEVFYLLLNDDSRKLAEDILEYANKVDLVFFYSKGDRKFKERLVDFPLETFNVCPCTKRPLYVSLCLRRPEVVRLLLNYGAKFPYDDVCYCQQEHQHPLQKIMGNMTTALQTCDLLGFRNIQQKRFAKCLRVLLVDLLYTNVLRSRVCQTLKEISEEDSCVIPSLKHISRARIRSTMKENRHLCSKKVFEILYLPKVLTSYASIDECSSFYDY